MAKTVSDFDTLGELYASSKATGQIFDAFAKSGLVNKMDLPQYVSDGHITEAGKEFFETAMVGSVMNENNIRRLNIPGAKSIRAKLVRAIVPLVENKNLNGYSINKELNDAVDIAIQVGTSDRYKNVDDFSRQGNFFEQNDRVAVELAKRLEGTQKGFAEFLQRVNGGLKPAANGEIDLLIGGTESKDDILNRFLSIKKAIRNIKAMFAKGMGGVFGGVA
jgi:hypothetical protein